MDPIVDVTGDEAKMAMIQFLGQNMSELRQLDSFIINKTNTLQGFSLNAQEIVDKIPGGKPPGISSESIPVPAVQQVVTQPVFHVASAQCQVLPEQPKDQLEFDFKYDVARDIAEQLEKVNMRLSKIEAILIAIDKRVNDIKPVSSQKKT